MDTSVSRDHVSREEFGRVDERVSSLEGWVRSIDFRFWAIIICIAGDGVAHFWGK